MVSLLYVIWLQVVSGWVSMSPLSLGSIIQIPVFVGADVLKNPAGDAIWPTSLSERPLPKFRYFYCRGRDRPNFQKTEVPITAEWNLPVDNKVDSEYSRVWFCRLGERERKVWKRTSVEWIGAINRVRSTLRLLERWKAGLDEGVYEINCNAVWIVVQERERCSCLGSGKSDWQA